MVQRAILFAALASAAAVLLVPAAAADPPVKVPLPFPPTSGPFCEDFDVLIEATDNKEVLHVFSSGVGLITGVLKVEVTNLSTQKTLALNISGPGKFSADGSTLTGSGRWLLFGEAGQLPGAEPGMNLITGHMLFELGPTGITSADIRGQVVDVCEALAGT
jgi:hypothetical protein